MNYSWKLFVDKINQKVPLLTEVKNPRIEFNNQKYFEYIYGERLEELEYAPGMQNQEDVEEFLEDQERKLVRAIRSG